MNWKFQSFIWCQTKHFWSESQWHMIRPLLYLEKLLSLTSNGGCGLEIRIAISHEKQEIKEFYDKKFLTRKTGKKNNKLTKVKKALRKASIKRIFEILLKI